MAKCITKKARPEGYIAGCMACTAGVPSLWRCSQCPLGRAAGNGSPTSAAPETPRPLMETGLRPSWI